MEEELNSLKKTADFFKKTTAKIKLLKLIKMAKAEYDKYDYQSGLDYLEEAYKTDKNNPVVLRGIGCIKQFQGKYKEALEYYQKAVNFSKDKEIEYTLIGMIHYLTEELDEAVKYFNLAIDTNDDYTAAYEGRNQAMLENHLKIIDLQETLKKYF